MKSPCATIVAVFLLCELACANKVGRTYENDSLHKRPVPKQTKYARQEVGYEEFETTSEYWWQKGQSTLQAKLDAADLASKAKNVVFFIGDGMSSQTVAATRMYLGNENKMLSFEEFPYLATAKTYCIDQQVADSACTATAYLTGVKINHRMINIAPSVHKSSCAYNRTDSDLFGLLKWAQDSGMATGVVTTARVTHATPAGAYASIAERDWEDDSYIVRDGCDPVKYPDIAVQLVHGEVGKNINVVLGGGRRFLLPTSQVDEENSAGHRTDGRNLINDWKKMHSTSGEYVWNKAGLQAVDVSKTEYLLGLFESDHCLYNLQIEAGKLQASEPSLTEMVEVAIKMLSKRERGYVLFVEGGKIDMAHHESRARLALDETAEYAKAVDLARRMTSVDDTLVVVSADHSHTMTYNGYTKRGSDVLGIADISDSDGLPYTTLSYANGRGYYLTYKEENRSERADISGHDYTDFRTQYIGTVPLESESHGGDDVAVYASGPMAHIFQGSLEQHVIPHLIAYAAEIGEYKPKEDNKDDDPGSGASLVVCLQLTVACGIAALISRLNW